jgi:XapX domain-containing protein
MTEIILSLVAGLVVGILFTLLKLPIPAPPVLSGIMGIVGVYLGSVIVNFITTKFF